MRLIPLLVAAILTTSPVWAQSSQSSSAGESPTKAKDDAGKPDQSQETGNLPVSLDKIQQALSLPPALSLRGVHEAATEEAVHFRVEVQERRKLEELISTLDFKSGPPVPGGLYAAEIQRITNSSVDHPRTQPYTAFSTSELLTIAIENLAGKYLAGRAVNAVTTAERERAERDAREEVAHALSDFCAAQPDAGADLESCHIASPADTR